MNAYARIEDKFTIGDACWDWTAAKTAGGYGELTVDSQMTYAHRFVYELQVGPIPDGLEIDHLCRNKGCVRPDHLEPVTHQENGRRAATRRSHCNRNHPLVDGNLSIDNRGRRECLTCKRRRGREWARKRSTT